MTTFQELIKTESVQDINSLSHMIQVCFARRYFSEGFPVFESNGTSGAGDFDAILKELTTAFDVNVFHDEESLPTKPVMSYFSETNAPPPKENLFRRVILVSDTSCVVLTRESHGGITARGLFFNEGLKLKFHSILGRVITPVLEVRKWHTIVQGQNGLELKTLAPCSNPLVFDNYSQDVQEAANAIIEQFDSPTPNGRLAILLGLPGSGKTYLVEGICNSMKRAVPVLLPLSLLPDIGGPQAIGSFIDFQEQLQAPILLIIEDADSALAPRQSDNISQISQLLNLTDGILGRALDIRVIATSNIKNPDLDEALTRPGRLLLKADVDTLTWEHAKDVAARLGVTLTEKREYSLAEIYKNPNKKETKPKRVVGF